MLRTMGKIVGPFTSTVDWYWTVDLAESLSTKKERLTTGCEELYRYIEGVLAGLLWYLLGDSLYYKSDREMSVCWWPVRDSFKGVVGQLRQSKKFTSKSSEAADCTILEWAEIGFSKSVTLWSCTRSTTGIDIELEEGRTTLLVDSV